MRNNVLVADLMTRDPVITRPDTNLLECARLMVRRKVGSLLLVKNKKLVGLIAEKDILWALIKQPNDLKNINAIDISPRKIATVKPLNTIREAIEKMKKTRFERLPVIHQKELVGILTAKDILNFHPEFYHELEEIEEIREKIDKFNRLKKSNKNKLVEGVCERCGNVEILHEFNGTWICESCESVL
ncbi:CBS domain-containing protein [Candidatus Pacearchaeota archaeon]|nr:CBS domain-containing protein [Candidatus Pacearchaeota archaeon]